jgi:hypothetical protein
MHKNITGIITVLCILPALTFALVIHAGESSAAEKDLPRAVGQFEEGLASGPRADFASAGMARLRGSSQLSGSTPTTPVLIEQAFANGEISADQAHEYLSYALSGSDLLPEQFQSEAPWDGTLAILHFEQALSLMGDNPSGLGLQTASSVGCNYSTGALPNTRTTDHFFIEYGQITGGLTIDDYIQALETTWGTEVTSFGWAAPPVSISNPAPGGLYHVRIDNLGGGLYGYVSGSGAHAGFVGDNPNTTWTETDAYASCMVLNNNYSGFLSLPKASLESTTAHEFSHAIQFGYGALTGYNVPDDIFIEGGATWIEDEVFDESNDNYNYLWPDFRQCMGQYNASPYAYWITLRAMTELYGTGPGGGEDVMQEFWESTSREEANNLGALDGALRKKGTNLADAYHAYAIAARFNKPCGGSYNYPYCLKEGPDYVSQRGNPLSNNTIGAADGEITGNLADNFSLTWIDLPAGDLTYDVTLTNTSGGGKLRASLVCDTGSSLEVSPIPGVARAQDTISLKGYSSAGCTAVVAVLTNQSKVSDNPASCELRSYQLRLDQVTGAAPVTPTPVPTPVISVPPVPGGEPQQGQTMQFFYLPILAFEEPWR